MTDCLSGARSNFALLFGFRTVCNERECSIRASSTALSTCCETHSFLSFREDCRIEKEDRRTVDPPWPYGGGPRFNGPYRCAFCCRSSRFADSHDSECAPALSRPHGRRPRLWPVCGRCALDLSQASPLPSSSTLRIGRLVECVALDWHCAGHRSASAERMPNQDFR